MPPVSLLLAASVLLAQDLAPGQTMPDVVTKGDPSQSYALYLPSAYAPSRAWPVILAFDPGGRGTTAIERYRAAAEQYGFIVAASNNSRNYSNNDRAVVAMANDVLARFRIDDKRVYTAGMSGGARVALGTALASNGIAGVIASSAGFPDATPRVTVPFAIFATAGTEDFNHLEMRRLDGKLISPHRLVIFEGGHTWLSSELAIDAVEWMNIQAMKAGGMPRDAAMIARILAKRESEAEAVKDKADAFLAWKSIVDDFKGLAETSAAADRAADLASDQGVIAGLKANFDEDNRETDILLGVKRSEAQLATPSTRAAALADLDKQWQTWSTAAKTPDDTRERRLARRIIGLLGSTVTTTDPDYLKIIAQYRLGRGQAPPR